MGLLNLSDATIHFFEAGRGDDAVLFLHAFPLHAAMWEPQLAAVAAEGWRAIAVDARGFGNSAPPPAQLTMDRIADDAAAVLDRLGIARAVVCGLSMGGYAAFELVRRHEPRVRGLVLADTSAAPDTDLAQAAREAFARNALTQGESWVANELLPKLLAAPAEPETEAKVKEIILESSPEAVAAAQRGMALRGDSRPLLGAVSVPTCVIVGEKDGLTSPAEAREMARQIPRAQQVEIAGAGHLSNLDRPDAFNAAMADFLALVRG